MLTVYQQTIHSYMSDVLKDKYPKNAKAIERVASMMLTRVDVEEFILFISEVYKTGFERAAESYKDQLLKLGYEVRVSHPKEGV